MAALRGRAVVAVGHLVDSNLVLTVVVPLLNEEALVQDFIAETLAKLPANSELILVDGGSTDRSVEIAELATEKNLQLGVVDSEESSNKTQLQVIKSAKGRATQMNRGASAAGGEYLMFLHVDTRLPEDFDQSFTRWAESKPAWGFAKVGLEGQEIWCRIISASINLRTRLTQGASGDQGQVVRADIFAALNGFRGLALMEDIDLSYRLRKNNRSKRLPIRLATSSRRWRENGPLKTVLLMWYLRLSFLLGASPDRLAAIYAGKNSRCLGNQG